MHRTYFEKYISDRHRAFQQPLKGEQTFVELSQRYQVHPNQITEWKKQLFEHAPDIFSKDRKPEQGPSVKNLHAKIGQLSMENDFLSGALGRIAFVGSVMYHYEDRLSVLIYLPFILLKYTAIGSVKLKLVL